MARRRVAVPVRPRTLLAVFAMAASCSSTGVSPEAAPSTTAEAEQTTTPASNPSTTLGASVDDTEVARAVCAALRSYVNDLVGIANTAVDGIGARQPDQRINPVLEGFDAAIVTIGVHRDAIGRLTLRSVPERSALLTELVAGLDDATAELVDERAAFVERFDELVNGSAQGIAGIWFNAIEKAISVSEPEIYRYDRVGLKQAFLDEPDCRHVIQQFEIDGSS